MPNSRIALSNETGRKKNSINETMQVNFSQNVLPNFQDPTDELILDNKIEKSIVS